MLAQFTWICHQVNALGPCWHKGTIFGWVRQLVAWCGQTISHYLTRFHDFIYCHLGPVSYIVTYSMTDKDDITNPLIICPKPFNIRHTLVGNKIVDHQMQLEHRLSSLFFTSMDWAKATEKRDEKDLFGNLVHFILEVWQYLKWYLNFFITVLADILAPGRARPSTLGHFDNKVGHDFFDIFPSFHWCWICFHSHLLWLTPSQQM